jgi:hypothetical protein
MLKTKQLLFLFVVLISCKTTQTITKAKKDQFTQDLNTLKDFLHIPGYPFLLSRVMKYSMNHM